MRKDARVEAHDVIRWKRPGRAEDHKGWAVDKSPTSLGFLTPCDAAPQVGEIIHVRFRAGDDWLTLDKTVQIARAELTPTRDLVMVGCVIAAGPAIEPEHNQASLGAAR
jgi:hypothetical protein